MLTTHPVFGQNIGCARPHKTKLRICTTQVPAETVEGSNVSVFSGDASSAEAFSVFTCTLNV